MDEPDHDAEARLPEGKACGDCRHIVRCDLFGFSSPEQTSCDFWPSQYVEANPLNDGAHPTHQSNAA